MDLPDTVYYDCNIVNNDQSGTKAPPRIVFSDIRSIPILTSPELYHCVSDSIFSRNCEFITDMDSNDTIRLPV